MDIEQVNRLENRQKVMKSRAIDLTTILPDNEGRHSRR